jgi:hypothetical protein
VFITSNNYAQHSSLIYSQTLEQETANKLDFTKKEIVNFTSNDLFKATTYKLLNFELKNGSIIYSDTDQVLNLFSILKKYKTLNNITLVTSQSDTSVNEKIYNKKPDCITRWFSSNVDIEKSDLFPIPLGISNSFSKKNITENDLSLIPKTLDTKNKNLSMYLNFNVNTNTKERGHLYEMFKNKEWCNIEKVSANNQNYIEKIKKNMFVLCPWGNGIETHRLWEALYLGSIPITKYHRTHRNYQDLPILFVDSYQEISMELLENYLKNTNFSNSNLKKLNIDYWKNIIHETSNKSDVSHSEIVFIDEPNFLIFYYRYKNLILKNFMSKLKVAKFYLRKLLKLRRLIN